MKTEQRLEPIPLWKDPDVTSYKSWGEIWASIQKEHALEVLKTGNTKLKIRRLTINELRVYIDTHFEYHRCWVDVERKGESYKLNHYFTYKTQIAQRVKIRDVVGSYIGSKNTGYWIIEVQNPNSAWINPFNKPTTKAAKRKKPWQKVVYNILGGDTVGAFAGGFFGVVGAIIGAGVGSTIAAVVEIVD